MYYISVCVCVCVCVAVDVAVRKPDPITDHMCPSDVATYKQELADDESSLEDRVNTLEHKLYPAALGLVAAGKVVWQEDGKLVRSS